VTGSLKNRLIHFSGLIIIWGYRAVLCLGDMLSYHVGAQGGFYLSDKLSSWISCDPEVIEAEISESFI
jgi:hypothetical protein